MALAEIPLTPNLHMEAVTSVPADIEDSMMLSLSGMALAVRAQVEHDVETWQALPLLALYANGKAGHYDDDLTFLSNFGVYRLADDPGYPNHNPYRISGLFGYFVDCVNGTIVRLQGDVDSIHDDKGTTQDKELYRIIGIKAAQDKLSDLSAVAVRAGLQAIVDAPVTGRHSASSEASRQAHIAAQIEQRKITDRFTRDMMLRSPY